MVGPARGRRRARVWFDAILNEATKLSVSLLLGGFPQAKKGINSFGRLLYPLPRATSAGMGRDLTGAGTGTKRTASDGTTRKVLSFGKASNFFPVRDAFDDFVTRVVEFQERRGSAGIFGIGKFLIGSSKVAVPNFERGSSSFF